MKKPMALEDVMERWKSFGVYALNLFYGEGIGCDDSDIQPSERRVRMIGVPVGCLGEAVLLYNGTVASLKSFDPKRHKPTRLPNPLGNISRKPGFYIWGECDESVDNAMAYLYRNRRAKRVRCQNLFVRKHPEEEVRY